MRVVSEKNIARICFLYFVLVIGLVTFAVGALFVVHHHESASAELAALEQRVIDWQKRQLEVDVTAFIDWIDRQRGARVFEPLPPPAAGHESGPSRVDDTPAGHWLLADLDRSGTVSAGSFFIYQVHAIDGGKDFATMLYHPGRPDLVGRRLSDDYPDAGGFQFRKAFLQDIRSGGDSFLTYRYENSGDSARRSGRKLAYFRLYPDWNWIVAKSIRLDALDDSLARSRAEYQAGLVRGVVLLGLLFVGAVVLASFFSFFFARDIQSLFAGYRSREQGFKADLAALEKSIQQRSNTDSLTGTYNREFFGQELGKEMARVDRYQHPLALLILEVDQLRAINETVGHHAGDTVLKEMARLIADNIRRTDQLARWSGEEFAVLAPGIDLPRALTFAEKLRDLVARAGFSVERPITCSIGVSCYEPGEKSREFLQRAENAVEQAEASGGDCCVAL